MNRLEFVVGASITFFILFVYGIIGMCMTPTFSLLYLEMSKMGILGVVLSCIFVMGYHGTV